MSAKTKKIGKIYQMLQMSIRKMECRGVRIMKKNVSTDCLKQKNIHTRNYQRFVKVSYQLSYHRFSITRVEEQY